MYLEKEASNQQNSKPLIEIMVRMAEFGPSLGYVLNYVLDRIHDGKTKEEIETDMQAFIEQKRKEYLARYS